MAYRSPDITAEYGYFAVFSLYLNGILVFLETRSSQTVQILLESGVGFSLSLYLLVLIVNTGQTSSFSVI
jgi:hypothetical protein